MRSKMYGVLLALSASFTHALAADGSQPVPTAKEVLGFNVGDRPASYEEAKAYLAALESGSERIESSSYGVTVGGRKLMLLTISSPANLARLDDVRSKLAQLGDAPDERTAALLIGGLPAVAWMGYGGVAATLVGGTQNCGARRSAGEDMAAATW